MLRGDEVGSLLGAHILSRGVAADAVFANSIVSSRLLAAMAAHAGIRHEETLTGFKWISRVAGLRYGYEEALGYCVDPAQVRDKDGVSAALLVAEMAADLRDPRPFTARRPGRPLAHARGPRHRLLRRPGRRPETDRHPDVPAAGEPAGRGGRRVGRPGRRSGRGLGAAPPTDGLRYHLEDESRVIVRPSGTEPKLKVYLEVIVRVEGSVRAPSGLADARAEAARPAGPGGCLDAWS